MKIKNLLKKLKHKSHKHNKHDKNSTNVNTNRNTNHREVENVNKFNNGVDISKPEYCNTNSNIVSSYGTTLHSNLPTTTITNEFIDNLNNNKNFSDVRSNSSMNNEIDINENESENATEDNFDLNTEFDNNNIINKEVCSIDKKCVSDTNFTRNNNSGGIKHNGTIESHEKSIRPNRKYSSVSNICPSYPFSIQELNNEDMENEEVDENENIPKFNDMSFNYYQPSSSVTSSNNNMEIQNNPFSPMEEALSINDLNIINESNINNPIMASSAPTSLNLKQKHKNNLFGYILRKKENKKKEKDIQTVYRHFSVMETEDMTHDGIIDIKNNGNVKNLWKKRNTEMKKNSSILASSPSCSTTTTPSFISTLPNSITENMTYHTSPIYNNNTREKLKSSLYINTSLLHEKNNYQGARSNFTPTSMVNSFPSSANTATASLYLDNSMYSYSLNNLNTPDSYINNEGSGFNRTPISTKAVFSNTSSPVSSDINSQSFYAKFKSSNTPSYNYESEYQQPQSQQKQQQSQSQTYSMRKLSNKSSLSGLNKSCSQEPISQNFSSKSYNNKNYQASIGNSSTTTMTKENMDGKKKSNKRNKRYLHINTSAQPKKVVPSYHPSSATSTSPNRAFSYQNQNGTTTTLSSLPKSSLSVKMTPKPIVTRSNPQNYSSEEKSPLSSSFPTTSYSPISASHFSLSPLPPPRRRKNPKTNMPRRISSPIPPSSSIFLDNQINSNIIPTHASNPPNNSIIIEEDSINTSELNENQNSFSHSSQLSHQEEINEVTKIEKKNWDLENIENINNKANTPKNKVEDVDMLHDIFHSIEEKTEEINLEENSTIDIKTTESDYPQEVMKIEKNDDSSVNNNNNNNNNPSSPLVNKEGDEDKETQIMGNKLVININNDRNDKNDNNENIPFVIEKSLSNQTVLMNESTFRFDNANSYITEPSMFLNELLNNKSGCDTSEQQQQEDSESKLNRKNFFIEDSLINNKSRNSYVASNNTDIPSIKSVIDEEQYNYNLSEAQKARFSIDNNTAATTTTYYTCLSKKRSNNLNQERMKHISKDSSNRNSMNNQNESNFINDKLVKNNNEMYNEQTLSFIVMGNSKVNESNDTSLIIGKNNFEGEDKNIFV